jgi:hypothetical protein
MPIKGLSEIVRLPRLGKIHLGVKKKNNEGVAYPMPTDYFVCPEEVKKVFGEKPKELRVMFPTEYATQWAAQYLRRYSRNGRLLCRGDGETSVARTDILTGEITPNECVKTELREITCNPEKCFSYQRGDCRRVLNLQFLLPDCPGFGVYQLDTSSFYSIVNVNSSLELIKHTCGRLSMLPLSLKLIEREYKPEAENQTFKILSLTTHYSLFEIQKFAQVPPGQILLLPAPDGEAPDDLFPKVKSRQNTVQSNSQCDNELMHLWDKAKRLINQVDMQNFQVVHYFSKFYHIEVNLHDFEAAAPLAKFTVKNLSGFIKDVKRHTQF